MECWHGRVRGKNSNSRVEYIKLKNKAPLAHSPHTQASYEEK